MSKANNNKEERYVECPHCLVYSVKLTAEESALVDKGQQMMIVCQVCGKEILLNG